MAAKSKRREPNQALLAMRALQKRLPDLRGRIALNVLKALSPLALRLEFGLFSRGPDGKRRPVFPVANSPDQGRSRRRLSRARHKQRPARWRRSAGSPPTPRAKSGARVNAAFRRNRLNAENVIDSKSVERDSSEKTAPRFFASLALAPWEGRGKIDACSFH
jgi:hypothetical protein